LLTEENPNKGGFSTNRIYERYQATTEKVDMKTLSEHRVYELLKE
jgi:cell division control protein 6